MFSGKPLLAPLVYKSNNNSKTFLIIFGYVLLVFGQSRNSVKVDVHQNTFFLSSIGLAALLLRLSLRICKGKPAYII